MNTRAYAIEDIEYIISVHLRPSYLLVIGLEENTNEINVIISCSQFNTKTIQKRVAIVFNLLFAKLNGKMLDDFLIIAYCFNREEMLEYIDNCFEEKI